MLTPFHEDGAIDWRGVDEITDWYIAQGAVGLFSVALSSEMYELSPEERLALAERVVHRAAGRAPVVASGTFGGPLVTQAEFVRRMHATGVDGVVVLSCQLAAEGEPDSVWLESAERLMEMTPGVPLGLYECPVPYKRVLSPAVMAWAARSGRFLFHKDTCCQVEPIRAKVEAVSGTPFRFYNANTPSLLDSLRAGGDGFSGIGANFHPWLYAWLCREHETQPERADRLQWFLSVADKVVSHKYPAAAKISLAGLGLSIGPYCRAGNPSFDEEELRMIEHMRLYALALGRELRVGPAV
jgi:4-hydroxy-tetrahydrodipicolinate synthase